MKAQKPVLDFTNNAESALLGTQKVKLVVPDLSVEGDAEVKLDLAPVPSVYLHCLFEKGSHRLTHLVDVGQDGNDFNGKAADNLLHVMRHFLTFAKGGTCDFACHRPGVRRARRHLRGPAPGDRPHAPAADGPNHEVPPKGSCTGLAQRESRSESPGTSDRDAGREGPSQSGRVLDEHLFVRRPIPQTAHDESVLPLVGKRSALEEVHGETLILGADVAP